MTDEPLDIVQVSWRDREGGAERLAADLSRWLRARGHRSVVAVGERVGDDDHEHVITIPNGARRGPWFGACRGAARATGPLAPRLARILRHAAEPANALARLRGREPMHFPGTRRLPGLAGRIDVLHCHNLHRDYFDLRELPRLSRAVPTLLTLHDAWLFSGHCAHSLGCERWRAGCGACPDLALYPPVRRDATAANWRLKRDVFQDSRLAVATPSRWLMRRVEASVLAPAVVDAQVIPNGVDLSVFRPGDRSAAREALGLPRDARVLLCVANRLRGNPFKDYRTLRKSLAQLADEGAAGPRALVCLMLGDDGPPERLGPRCEVRPAGFEADPARVAAHYQAADVYVHAARADTFPTTVLEALACGTPVVASSVGGVPEQVRSLSAVVPASPIAEPADAYPPVEATGVLVAPEDPAALADAVRRLLEDETLRATLAANAAADARSRFDANERFGDYLAWYREMAGATPTPPGAQDVGRACARGMNPR